MSTPSLDLRVGTLAARAGVSVRTLHHYEAVGLLHPRRTAAGHRRYGLAEAERLQQITSLRALGLGLESIRDVLDAPDFDPVALVARHRAALDAEADRLAVLADRLYGFERLLCQRVDTGTPVTADTFLSFVNAMYDPSDHYTPEQLADLAARRRQLGDDHIHAVEAEWPRLFQALGTHLDAGSDPSEPEVQALVDRWDALVEQFTGGDPGLHRALGDAWEANLGAISDLSGPSPERLRALFAYAQQARDAR